MKTDMDFNEFENKRILVTGATGLIGRAIVKYLANSPVKPIYILALVRDENKAKEIFSDIDGKRIEYVVGDITDFPAVPMNVDYIIHGASITASASFAEKPVEVISVSVKGMENILEFAKVNPVKSLVYLSTMEIYGTNLTDDKVDENAPAFLDTVRPRSCYPESKRLCECMCASYAAEYGVPAKIARLTLTFGENIPKTDKRVFAEFARSVINGKDIVLKTKGETRRNYIYTEDAVRAILTVLLNGKVCEAYNVANEETYCSIYDMAKMVTETFGNGKTKVIIDESVSVEKLGYAPTLRMNLDCTKLKALGWKPTKNLKQMFEIMIDDMKANYS